jgi:hypothetical protein
MDQKKYSDTTYQIWQLKILIQYEFCDILIYISNKQDEGSIIDGACGAGPYYLRTLPIL